MINDALFVLPDDLIAEYRSVFQQNDDVAIFRFLRKYLRHIESDNSAYNHYFELGDPLVKKNTKKQFMTEFNKTINIYLNHMLKSGAKNRKGGVSEGEVACYFGAAHEYGLFDMGHNLELAFYYYTIAAQLHSDLGTFRLALCYERGLGTDQSIKKAVYFFRCAAKHGLVDAMHVYGVILANGYLGLHRDMELGLHYLSLAALKADATYPYSLYDIGSWYENNSNDSNIISDDGYAYEIYLKGAQFKEPNSMHRLALAYDTGSLGRRVDKSKAFEYYKMAASKGQMDAQFALTEKYFSGVGQKRKRSAAQSYSWGLRAATQGLSRAAYILGEYSAKGFGTSRSILQALWWYTIASQFGSEEAVQKILEIKHEVHKQDEGPFVQSNCCTLFC